MSDLLPGSFDLHIIDTCNLHCKGCIVLDYLQGGRVTNTRYEIDKKTVNNFVKIPNSVFQYNSAKNNTTPNWMTYLAI